MNTVSHNCRHGSRRQKRTLWWCTDNTYVSLAMECSGKHTHAPWAPKIADGRIASPTAEEAAYPHLLCTRVANILLAKSLALGANAVDTMEHQVQTLPTTSHKWVLDMLPRGKKFRPLVSQFQAYQTLAVRPDTVDLSSFLQHFPKGTTITTRRMKRGVFRVEGSLTIFYCAVSPKDDDRILIDVLDQSIELGVTMDAQLCTLGIPREPWDFLQRAIEAGHPRSMSIHLTREIIEALEYNFRLDQFEIVDLRAKFLHRWTQKSQATEA